MKKLLIYLFCKCIHFTNCQPWGAFLSNNIIWESINHCGYFAPWFCCICYLLFHFHMKLYLLDAFQVYSHLYSSFYIQKFGKRIHTLRYYWIVIASIIAYWGRGFPHLVTGLVNEWISFAVILSVNTRHLSLSIFLCSI